MYLWKLLHVFEEVVPGDTLGDPVGGRLNTGSCNRSTSRLCYIICMSIIYIRIFFIVYYIVYYIYHWSGEWLAHRLMEGIEAVLVVVAGSVMQGPPGDQVVLNNHGDNVTTYSAKWWLRQGNPVMEGRDLYIRHVIFPSDSLGGRKRCTDKLLTNSLSFRQAPGCLYYNCLSRFWHCNWGQAWTGCFNRKSKLCLLEHLTFLTFLVMEQSSMLWRTQPLNLPKFHRLLFPAGGNMRRFCASYVESSLKREVWNWVKSANDNIGHRMPAGLPSKILSIPSGSYDDKVWAFAFKAVATLKTRNDWK